ncbi:MAG: carbohydrate kinase family protein [Promethearchaeota archaeon]|nr:MAG: carbohydrate kinase family protein [Candidatus Lokiarchaeota archaeon]
MKKVDIIGLGEVVVDWVARIPYYPKPDEKIDAITEDYFSGGVTANFLVAIARLGGNCGFIGAVGEDDYGKFLLDDFKAENVDTSMTIIKEDKATPVNFIMVVEGEKSIIQSPKMQTTRLLEEELNETYISKAKILHTTLIHQDIAEKAINIAKENNVRISIDLEPQIALRGWNNLQDILLKADVIIPNKEGAKMITGCSTPELAARFLIKKGIPLVIITMGKNGCLVTTKNFQKKFLAYKIDNVVDTTGAGDTFNGAFSMGYWIKKWPLEKACKYANAAAGLKIMKLGARTGMPREDEVRKFLKINDLNFSDD